MWCWLGRTDAGLQVVHAILHALGFGSDPLDSVQCGNELVVVFVNEHLHVAVKGAHFSGNLVGEVGRCRNTVCGQRQRTWVNLWSSAARPSSRCSVPTNVLASNAVESMPTALTLDSILEAAGVMSSDGATRGGGADGPDWMVCNEPSSSSNSP